MAKSNSSGAYKQKSPPQPRPVSTSTVRKPGQTPPFPGPAGNKATPTPSDMSPKKGGRKC